MGNQNIRNNIQNLQKLMISIIDENNEMKGMIKKIEQDILKLTGENVNRKKIQEKIMKY